MSTDTDGRVQEMKTAALRPERKDSDWDLETIPERKFVDVNGVSTCYHEAGLGAPILFVYGGSFGYDLPLDCHTWSRNIFPLSDNYRAIAVDKLGQGYTENPLADEDYTMDAIVEHIGNFIDALDLPPVHIVGQSRGGYVACRLALLRPHQIRTLTIVNSSTLAPGVGMNEVVGAEPPYPPGDPKRSRWFLETFAAQQGAVTNEWVEACHSAGATAKYLETVRKMEEGRLKVSQFLPTLARDKLETLTWIEQGRLQRPTQLIWGSDDPTVSIERGMSLFEMIAAHERHTVMHTINECSHWAFREHHQRFNALLSNFVEAHQG